MGIASTFRNLFGVPERTSADTAKERLMVMISHQRNGSDTAPEFLPQLEAELMNLLRKYMPAAQDGDATVQFTRDDGADMLKVDISLSR